MRIFNVGSLNIDHVYSVDHFVRPGETIAGRGYERFCGGKGCNQSVALASAGAEVVHVGRVGHDGTWLKERLSDRGADVSFVSVGEVPTGHAIIQVSGSGENAIIVHRGANRALSAEHIDRALAAALPGDLALVQNETSCVGHVLSTARARGLITALNPAPFDDAVLEYPLECVDLFFVNETEGRGLSGESEPDAMLRSMLGRFPGSRIVLTLGEEGARYRDAEHDLRVPAIAVTAIDTTAAGDTFIGYFLAEHSRGTPVEHCLRWACRASALCVTRPGATDAIPWRQDVASFEPNGGARP